MPDLMSGAEIAATRHLIGLTQQEFADKLGVSRQSVKDWERSKFSARPGVIADITALRHRHDAATRDLVAAAENGTVIGLPDGPEPRGWYLAMGARVIDEVPDAILDWV